MIRPFFTTSLIAVLFVLSAGTNTVYAQNISVESMKALLESKVGYTTEDFKAVDGGEIVVKRVAGTEKHGIAVCGLIRLAMPFDVVLEGFRYTINQQKKSTAKDFGRFSIPPSAKDLDDLEFDEGDIRTLRNCRVGNCSWNFPAPMIKRLNSEIDWKSPEHASEAAALIKSMLIDYAGKYFGQGDSALIEYNDKPKTLRLADEYETLQPTLFWADEFVPEFRSYYDNFPGGSLEGVENTASWAKIRVGLKPVVMFTHNINYKKEQNGVSQVLIVSKQIYANHYFDSTLGLTVIVGFTNKDGNDETYVLFLNRSRARALGGRIGKLIQGMVENQGVDRVRTVLYETKQDSARVLANRQGADPDEDEGLITSLWEYRNYLAAILIILLVVGGYLVVRWRFRNP